MTVVSRPWVRPKRLLRKRKTKKERLLYGGGGLTGTGVRPIHNASSRPSLGSCNIDTLEFAGENEVAMMQ